MYTYPVLSVLFAPAIVLGCAVLVFAASRIGLALYRPLRRALGAPGAERELPTPRKPSAT